MDGDGEEVLVKDLFCSLEFPYYTSADLWDNLKFISENGHELIDVAFFYDNGAKFARQTNSTNKLIENHLRMDAVVWQRDEFIAGMEAWWQQDAPTYKHGIEYMNFHDFRNHFEMKAAISTYPQPPFYDANGDEIDLS